MSVIGVGGCYRICTHVTHIRLVGLGMFMSRPRASVHIDSDDERVMHVHGRICTSHGPYADSARFRIKLCPYVAR